MQDLRSLCSLGRVSVYMDGLYEQGRGIAVQRKWGAGGPLCGMGECLCLV